LTQHLKVGVCLEQRYRGKARWKCRLGTHVMVKIYNFELGVVVHTCTPNSKEAKAQFQPVSEYQPVWVQTKTLPQNK
jgi:cytochrome c biogenesis factor